MNGNCSLSMNGVYWQLEVWYGEGWMRTRISIRSLRMNGVYWQPEFWYGEGIMRTRISISSLRGNGIYWRPEVWYGEGWLRTRFFISSLSMNGVYWHPEVWYGEGWMRTVSWGWIGSAVSLRLRDEWELGPLLVAWEWMRSTGNQRFGMARDEWELGSLLVAWGWMGSSSSQRFCIARDEWELGSLLAALPLLPGTPCRKMDGSWKDCANIQQKPRSANMASKQPEKIPALQMQLAEESPGTQYACTSAGSNTAPLTCTLV